MNQKIILTFVILILIFSCGKKADPEYKKLEKKSDIKLILKNKV
tara:strand:- start:268 stop:399 length:132 start_codon:yes stop_codon:yes gene_type:complete